MYLSHFGSEEELFLWPRERKLNFLGLGGLSMKNPDKANLDLFTFLLKCKIEKIKYIKYM